MLEFWGTFLGKVHTDNGDRVRWAELRLYKILDSNPEHDDSWSPDDGNRGMFGKQLWLLYTIGHTLVYHDLDAPCNRGVRSRVADFPSLNADWEELEPCAGCNPPEMETVPAGEEFRVEVTWYSYVPCLTVPKVIESLSKCAECQHKPHSGNCYRCGCGNYRGVLTSPGSKLFEIVKKADPDIAREAAGRVRKF